MDPHHPASIILSRRAFLRIGLAAQLMSIGSFSRAVSPAVSEVVGRRLSPWTRGTLDIHHIATGRGSATFIRMPDGTRFLIDAGAALNAMDVSAQPKPGSSRRPGEWIARYIERHLNGDKPAKIDYVLVSHLHPDHLGQVAEDQTVPGRQDQPKSKIGAYRLTGVMDVAEILPIGTLIDRGFPDYSYPNSLRPPFIENYLSFVKCRVALGERCQNFKVGATSQISMLQPAGIGTNFNIRNVASNGIVWTGVGESTEQIFPSLSSLRPNDYPTENMCSIAIKISYGNFGYYTGGDLTSDTFDGLMPWRDVQTPATKAVGHVDVATADHHGMWDGIGGASVRSLSPQAWVIPTWHISHPDLIQLERMFSEQHYAGPRDVFATNAMRETILANWRLMRRLLSTEGHVVVRVKPDGNSFEIAVTDNSDELDTVKLVAGPYKSTASNKQSTSPG